jgi:hypothetical protein
MTKEAGVRGMKRGYGEVVVRAYGLDLVTGLWRMWEQSGIVMCWRSWREVKVDGEERRVFIMADLGS